MQDWGKLWISWIRAKTICFVYLFNFLWTFGVFSHIGYCRWWYYEHWCKPMFEFLLWIFLCIYLELKLSALMVFCLIFWGNSILFSIAAIPFYIFTIHTWGFWFLHILDNTCHFPFLFFLNNNHPNGCEVVLWHILLYWILFEFVSGCSISESFV